jgi:hypothetical protein
MSQATILLQLIPLDTLPLASSAQEKDRDTGKERERMSKSPPDIAVKCKRVSLEKYTHYICNGLLEEHIIQKMVKRIETWSPHGREERGKMKRAKGI